MDLKILTFGRHYGKAYPEFFNIAQECYELTDMALSTLQERIKPGDELDIYKVIVVYNLYKAHDSFIAAVKLADAGLVDDSYVLNRKILEIVINLKYLSQDKDSRKTKYWNFLTLSSHKDIERALADEGAMDASGHLIRQLAKEAKKQLANIQQDYELNNEGEIKRKYFNSWSGKKIYEMACDCEEGKECDCEMGKEYDTVYRTLSKSAHASIEKIAAYYDTEHLVLGPQFPIHEVLHAVLESARIYLMVFEIAIDVFNLNLGKSLASIRRSIDGYKNDPRLNMD